jgi:type III secretion protein C
VLENRSEFHVRVSGFQDSSLFKVVAGTAVRVTPSMVDDGGRRGVMLAIDIEDGDIAGGTVDDIPIVRRRAVNTQALVGEGSSLLIAGYSSEETSKVTSGVPVLSSLPVVGRAFRVTEDKRLRMERFYLLTPRLVSPDAPPQELPATAPKE